MFIIAYRKIFYVFSAALFFGGVFMFFGWGLNLGVDFTGGSLSEMRLERQVSSEEIRSQLLSFNIGAVGVQKTSAGSFLIRFKEVDEETHQAILTKLQEYDSGAEELRFNSIGPIIGSELKQTARLAVILAIVGMLLYIGWAFRRMSRPLSGWAWGTVVVATLVFNSIVVLGIFSFLGKFYGVEVGLPFVAALLAVVGYSVNDTIIIFDRVRENIIKRGIQNFSETVGLSASQSLARSLNTSLTTLFVLLALFFFGGETLKYFVLTLALGIIVGTYASLFLASPVLADWAERKNRRAS